MQRREIGLIREGPGTRAEAARATADIGGGTGVGEHLDGDAVKDRLQPDEKGGQLEAARNSDAQWREQRQSELRVKMARTGHLEAEGKSTSSNGCLLFWVSVVVGLIALLLGMTDAARPFALMLYMVVVLGLIAAFAMLVVGAFTRAEAKCSQALLRAHARRNAIEVEEVGASVPEGAQQGASLEDGAGSP